MERLSIEMWTNIIRNVSELDADDLYGNEIEVLWLDGTDEWVLCHGEELFEDGFETEVEAWQRLEQVYKLVKENE